MPQPKADEIYTQKHSRLFRQPGGANPNNPLYFGGVDTQYQMLGAVSRPITGGITAIRVHDPRRPGTYRNIGRSKTPPDLPTATLTVMESQGSIPWTHGDMNCPQTFYELLGRCKDLSDFIGGWEGYVRVYSYGEATNANDSDRQSQEDDALLTTGIDYTFGAVYSVGALGFGEQAGAEVSREVIDVVYGTAVTCGDCGPSNDGTKLIYALTTTSGAGSPGLPAELIYSTDGGATWTQTNITSFGATEAPVAIDIVGNYLVIVGDNALYWAELNDLTGAPGTFTKVTTGFVALKQPQDIYVASPREVYFVGNGGYIYKSTDITAGVSVVNAGVATSQDLKRVTGLDEVIVAVGAAGAVVKSINRGATFATTTAAPGSDTLQAVAVLSDVLFWVGDNTGSVYYTTNGGETWTEDTLTGSMTDIRDIVFATDEVGYVAGATVTPAGVILATMNGGADWSSRRPRLQNVPTFDRANRIAVPQSAHPTVAVNNIAVAALGGDGTDGALFLASASLR